MLAQFWLNPFWFSDPQTWIPVQQHCPVARGNRSQTVWIGNDNRAGHWHIAKGHQRKGKTVAIKPENIKTNSRYTFFHGTTGCQSNCVHHIFSILLIEKNPWKQQLKSSWPFVKKSLHHVSGCCWILYVGHKIYWGIRAVVFSQVRCTQFSHNDRLPIR